MRVELLGPLAVHDATGIALNPGGPKQRAVLALLALNAGRVVSLDTLVDGVWGEDPPESALNSLQVYVHGLRKVLGAPEFISRRDPGYRLESPPVSTDVAEAADLRTAIRVARERGDLVAAAEGHRRLESLWRGEPLADLATMPFATYVAVALQEARLADLESGTELALRLGRHREVLPRIEELVSEHPTREGLWGQLMLALYRCGRQGDALMAFRRAREALAEELGVDPGPALQELEGAVLRQETWLAAPESVGSVAPPPSVEPPPLGHHLPRPPHDLLGRDDLVSSVVGSLRDGSDRLVTLIGAGGIGKTRTALAIAYGLLDEVDTVRAVDLAGVYDGDALVRELAGSLGLPPDESDLTTVAALLSGRRSVLLLDNLEQVADAGPVLTALLAAAPDVALLVTSRRALRVTGERLVQLDTLEVGVAVELFAERARLLRADFVVDASNREAVHELCRRLDGLPLALEIAAARIRLLTPHDMVSRLDEGLERLGSGLADLPERQRTLTATVQWSLDLLTPRARDLSTRLAVFEGGFTVEAAVAVCGPEDPETVLEGIEDLIDASLLVPLTGTGQARFRQLRPVRELLRSAADPAELDRLRQLRADHVAERVVVLTRDLDGPGHERAVLELEREADDIDASIEHWITRGDVSALARAVASLTPFWVAAGRLRDGLEVVRRARDLPGAAADPDLRAAQGMISYHLTDWASAIEHLGAAMESAVPDSMASARLGCHLGAALLVTGEPERGSAHARASLELALTQGWTDVQALALSALAIAAAIAGDYVTERRHYEQRLTLVRAAGDRARSVDTLSTLAEIDVDEGDWEAARRHAEEALELVGASMAAERRDTLVVLARVALAQADHAAATTYLTDALETSVGLGQPLGLAQVLRTAAGLAAATGRHAQAARLVGASEALRESLVIGEEVEVDLAGFAEAVRRALPPARYEEEVRAGRSLPRAEALSLVEDVLSGSSSESSTGT